jgi:GTPase Era involved in 16S rRNA processing
MLIHVKNINICLSQISKQLNIPQERDAIKNLFNYYICSLSRADMTLRVEFSLPPHSSPTPIYEWNGQSVKDRLIATGANEEDALNKIHQRQKNNFDLILECFIDLYYLKSIGNTYKPYLLTDSQFTNIKSNETLADFNDDLKSKYSQELLVGCIQEIQDTIIAHEREVDTRERTKKQMNSTNIQATKVRRKFAEKLEKIIRTLTAEENDANQNHASGALALTKYIEKLNCKKENLQNGTFTFLILGDFNRGKSTIINLLLGEKVLPTSVICCTKIPTIVKYGDEKKVLVYSKNDVEDVEQLSIEEFVQNPKYKSSNKTDPKQIKEAYAELYYPLPLLENGIEFIDTPGLNNSSEDDGKSLSYIDKIDAVFFVINATLQLTAKEKEYLKQYIQGHYVSTVFYLINFWDSLEDESQDTVRGKIIDDLSEVLEIDSDKVKEFWGKRIFEISAKKDLEIINQSKSLEGTTCEIFWRELNLFLASRRFSQEIEDARNISQSSYESIKKLVESRLVTLNDNVQQIHDKVDKSKPCFTTMKTVCQKLTKEVDSKREICANKIVDDYKAYADSIIDNFEQDFPLPELINIKNEEIENFSKNVEQTYNEYIQRKWKNWNETFKLELKDTYFSLADIFRKEIDKYQEEKDKIQDILQGNQVKINHPNYQETLDGVDPGCVKVEVPEVDRKAYTVPFLSMVGGGAGAVVAAEFAFVPFIIPIAGVGFFVGFAALLINGIKNKLNRITVIQLTKKQLQAQLTSTINETTLLKIRKHIESQFDICYSTISDLNDDVNALENSLNKLIEQKTTSEIDYDTERKRLNDLLESLSSQVAEIDKDYTNYLQSL